LSDIKDFKPELYVKSGSTQVKLAMFPYIGQAFYDTTLSLQQFYDGTSWTSATNIPISFTTTNYNIAPYESLFVDTSNGPITINLPISTIGEYVTIHDASGTISTNNLTISTSKQSDTIMGVLQSLVVTVNDRTIKLGYTGTDWRLL